MHPINGGHEPSPETFAEARQTMVERQLRRRGIADPLVLEAMGRVPREVFVPQWLAESAYADGPLPIDHGQTISQPYVVAAMTEALQLQPKQRVLEIGTGSGYQAAILAAMGMEVFSIECVPGLAESAAARIRQAGFTIHCRTGDGWSGWPEAAPFDGILVTAAPQSLPQPLTLQLMVGARLVIPIGRQVQYLYAYTRKPDGSLTEDQLFAVRFVPFVRG